MTIRTCGGHEERVCFFTRASKPASLTMREISNGETVYIGRVRKDKTLVVPDGNTVYFQMNQLGVGQFIAGVLKDCATKARNGNYRHDGNATRSLLESVLVKSSSSGPLERQRKRGNLGDDRGEEASERLPSAKFHAVSDGSSQVRAPQPSHTPNPQNFATQY